MFDSMSKIWFVLGMVLIGAFLRVNRMLGGKL